MTNVPPNKPNDDSVETRGDMSSLEMGLKVTDITNAPSEDVAQRLLNTFLRDGALGEGSMLNENLLVIAQMTHFPGLIESIFHSISLENNREFKDRIGMLLGPVESSHEEGGNMDNYSYCGGMERAAYEAYCKQWLNDDTAPAHDGLGNWAVFCTPEEAKSRDKLRARVEGELRIGLIKMIGVTATPDDIVGVEALMLADALMRSSQNSSGSKE